MRRYDSGFVRRGLREGGITLAEATAAITLVGLVLALLVPAIVRSSRVEGLVACRGHLKTLYEAQLKAPAPGPKEFGRAYWERLARATPPLVSAEALRCPLVDAPDAPACQYYGPAEDVSKRDAKDAIGCDMEHNHSDDEKQGGNVLLKSGEVRTDHTGIWSTALRSGKCRP
jgi:hypothetical protein